MKLKSQVLSESSDVVAVLREVPIVIESEEKLGQLRTGLTTSDGGQEAEEEAGLSSEVDRQGGEHLGLVFGRVGLGHPAEEEAGGQKLGQAIVNLKSKQQKFAKAYAEKNQTLKLWLLTQFKPYTYA